MTQQTIRRGILQSFNAISYTATVLIVEATNYVLSGVPIATSVDGTSAISGASCAVLFFDESNHTDAVIIAVYGSPAPSPTPGRVAFSTPVQQIISQTINNGVTSTFTMSGLPTGILGIIYRLTMNTATAGAFIYAGPHGTTLSNYIELDNPGIAGAFVGISGVLPVDTNSKIDIQANSGNCTVSLYTYGYIF